MSGSPLRLAVLGALLATSAAAHAHGEKLDPYGCHKNRGAGGYHCHKGPFAGRSFQSQEEMLKALNARKQGTTRRP
ncbi:MAG TPA: hypothetical protein VFV84_10755 [Burkholderiales bacterium]|nr:hypothetical protein [Burkholderiales bacterium]